MESIGKFFVSLSLAASLSVVSGCDFFRTLASRPTSDDIQAKREEIAAYQAKIQAEQDSIKAVEEARIKDSLLLQEMLANGLARPSSTLNNIVKEDLRFSYYIVIGAFASRQNADKLIEKVSQAGYEAVPLSFRNGFTAVGVNPSNSLVEICNRLSSLMEETFCPNDMWILVKE